MILVVTEQKNGKLDEVSFELLSFAKKLNAKLSTQIVALVLGKDPSLAKDLSSKAIAEVITISSPHLEKYNPDFFAAALKSLIEEKKPKALLFPYTPFGADLSPKVAATLKVGL